MLFLHLPWDRKAPPEARLVRQAAEALELSEFELFRAAHRAWCGADADARSLERDFGAYLTRRRLPAYVRHYARRVVAEAEAGGLGAHPETAGLPRRERPVEPGLWAVAVLLGAAFLVYILVLA